MNQSLAPAYLVRSSREDVRSQHRHSSQSLAQAYQALEGDSPADIPWLVWLLENPESPLALGGSISLRNHDYLHILLNRGFTPADEAFVIGMTMGNDPQTRSWHYLIFKFAARFLYPNPYRFSRQHLDIFEQGVQFGQSLPVKNLNRFDFSLVERSPVQLLRQVFMTPGSEVPDIPAN